LNWSEVFNEWGVLIAVLERDVGCFSLKCAIAGLILLLHVLKRKSGDAWVKLLKSNGEFEVSEKGVEFKRRGVLKYSLSLGRFDFLKNAGNQFCDKKVANVNHKEN
jgi:hypothetical protein